MPETTQTGKQNHNAGPAKASKNYRKAAASAIKLRQPVGIRNS